MKLGISLPSWRPFGLFCDPEMICEILFTIIISMYHCNATKICVPYFCTEGIKGTEHLTNTT